MSSSSVIPFEYKLFAGSHVPHVTSQDYKKRILKSFEHDSGIILPEKKIKKINAQNMSIFNKNAYYAIGLTDETDMYMYFTCFESYNYCFLIGKFVEVGYDLPKIILLNMNVLDTIYEGTILDFTRIFINKSKFLFLFKDIKLLSGTKIKKDYLEKIELLIDFFENSYIKSENQPFVFHVARPFNNLDSLMKRKLPYKLNRIIFYPSDSSQEIYQYFEDSRNTIASE